MNKAFNQEFLQARRDQRTYTEYFLWIGSPMFYDGEVYVTRTKEKDKQLMEVQPDWRRDRS